MFSTAGSSPRYTTAALAFILDTPPIDDGSWFADWALDADIAGLFVGDEIWMLDASNGLGLPVQTVPAYRAIGVDSELVFQRGLSLAVSPMERADKLANTLAYRDWQKTIVAKLGAAASEMAARGRDDSDGATTHLVPASGAIFDECRAWPSGFSLSRAKSRPDCDSGAANFRQW